MARLQDYNTVIPTNSDNILIVQSTGQGLATFGSTIGAKMDAANPTGTGSLSIGRKSGTTTGSQSVAVGYDVEASGTYGSHAEGRETIASGQSSHAEGRETQATINQAHAEGYQTEASGNSSHAEGYGSKSSANYSHAEGRGSTASGANGSHAEGYQTTSAGGSGAHAEGYQTTTTADSTSSHAEGYQTTSGGLASHSEGVGTIAQRRSQHVFGDYNIADTQGANANAKGAYIEIVGKGSNDSNRSNARTLDWSGNETIAGTLTQSSDERLKDIKAEDIPDVSDVKAVRFTWKEDAGRDEFEHIGYLAQDVEKVLPFLVKEDAEGNKVLDYIAFLVAKVDSLEKRIAELEK